MPTTCRPAWIPAAVLGAILVAGSPALGGAGTPGEAGNLRVTGHDRTTGLLTIVFDPACEAQDHHIELGPLEQVGIYGYDGQICGLGTSGSFDQFAPGDDSIFFLVVGNDGMQIEGSYGTSQIGMREPERPQDLIDPSCAYDQDLTRRCDAAVIPTLDLTAFRPQSESYGTPLARRAVPEADEELPGVGIRINGDDDDGNLVPDRDDTEVDGENDLIEVVLSAVPRAAPDGLEYRLRRTNGNIEAWETSNKGTAVFGAADERVVTFDAAATTLWIENPGGGEAELELIAIRVSDEVVQVTERVHFYPFSSVVIALGGEGQVPADPPLEPSNHGRFQLAIELVQLGYDVHMYDEDVVAANGAGTAFDEVVSAVADRGVSGVAIFGYSHGGGSTRDLAELLDTNRGSIGTFSIDFTGYVDGIQNDSDFDIDAETALPASTGYHANYYQNPGCGFLCGAMVPGADFDLDVTTEVWGVGLTHFTVDDAPEVLSGLRDQLILRLAR